jgi:D-sedoheptulose 7-phosphate isomerase
MKKRAPSFSRMRERAEAELGESAGLLLRLSKEESGSICRMAVVVAECLRKGGALLICGNGGSAADAQHFAGELVGRFMIERAPLRCIALSADSAILTALGNDYGFTHLFSRQVAAHGREGDLLLALSTSGVSPNLLEAVREARRLKMRVLAMSGRGGGPLARQADICITVPSKLSPRIQEAHAALGHILCGLVEESLFGK